MLTREENIQNSINEVGQIATKAALKYLYWCKNMARLILWSDWREKFSAQKLAIPKPPISELLMELLPTGNFSKSILIILDFYRASGYLGAVAAALHPQDLVVESKGLLRVVINLSTRYLLQLSLMNKCRNYLHLSNMPKRFKRTLMRP
jgi:hypothetical protein